MSDVLQKNKSTTMSVKIGGFTILEKQFNCDHTKHCTKSSIPSKEDTSIKMYCTNCGIITQTYPIRNPISNDGPILKLINNLRIMGFKNFEDLKESENTLNDLFSRYNTTYPYLSKLQHNY